MIGVWAICFAVSLSAAAMFYRGLDEANSWVSASVVFLGMLISLAGVILFAGFVITAMGAL